MIYQGTKRLFETPEQELDTTTGTARLLTIDGVASYDDINGKIIPVISYTDGGANATIKINDLAALPVYVCLPEGLVEAYDGWTTGGQLYYLQYSAENSRFVAFCISNCKIEDSVNPVCVVNYTVLALTSTSTAEEIAAAFGTSGVEEFSNAIQNNQVILFGSKVEDKNLIAIEYSETTGTENVTDVVSVLDLANSQIKTYTFTRPINLYNYSSVSLTTSSIGGGSSTDSDSYILSSDLITDITTSIVSITDKGVYKTLQISGENKSYENIGPDLYQATQLGKTLKGINSSNAWYVSSTYDTKLYSSSKGITVYFMTKNVSSNNYCPMCVEVGFVLDNDNNLLRANLMARTVVTTVQLNNTVGDINTLLDQINGVEV